MIRLLRLSWLKYRLGVWLVRKSYAQDLVVRDVCKRKVGEYRKKILKLSPLPRTPLSVAERVLSDGEVQRMAALLQPKPGYRTPPLWHRFIGLFGGVHG